MQQNIRLQLKVLEQVEAGYETWGVMLTEVFCPHLFFFTIVLGKPSLKTSLKSLRLREVLDLSALAY